MEKFLYWPKVAYGAFGEVPSCFVDLAGKGAAFARLFTSHQGPHVCAAHDACQVAGIVEIEDPQRQTVVAAHDDGSRVHDVELLGEHPIEGEVAVADRGRVAQRI